MAEWRQGSRHRKLRTPFLNHKNETESNLKVVGVFLTLKTLFNSSNKVTAPKLPQTASLGTKHSITKTMEYISFKPP